MMIEKLSVRASETSKMDGITKASIFRLSIEEDAIALSNLLDEYKSIRVRDEIDSQLRELIKLRYPQKKLSEEETVRLIQKHLGNVPQGAFGVWVYYPWSQTLVHILDEAEFAEVKTNRNKHKITYEESELLNKQIVGVVGLSVGRTIAATMTLERSYGEIRLADFDVLELSNYNRIRSGLFDLGLKKTVSLAREIAEIDPYLKVTCYHEGLTEETMDDFFSKDGQINVLIDECDGLDIKILLREKAKKLQIPVIMDMNDRGTMDIERFDLEPDRPLLHGLIGHLDSSKLKGLTNEQKIPYIMPMLGESTISTKLKASMLEIEQTITTWPQLGADVTLGGAVAANVYRRIVLDEFRDSGRYFIDMDELICDNVSVDPSGKDEFIKVEPLTWEDCFKSIEATSICDIEESIDLEDSEIQAIVEAAILAPSGGNAQPWKWVSSAKTLYLFKDQFQSDSLLDYKGKASLIGLGAAIENLSLKALDLGYTAHINTFSSTNDSLICSIQFTSSDEESDVLSDYIGIRSTNRGVTVSSEVSKIKLTSIQKQDEPFRSSEIVFLSDGNQINTITNLVASVERIRMMEKRGHADFLEEVRWTPEENEEQRNGIDIRTIDLTEGELTGFRMAKDWKVIDQLNKWNGGGAFEGLAIKSMKSAGAIGYITLTDKSNHGFLEAGRLLERCWLEASRQGLEFQPMSPSSFFFERLIEGDGVDLSAKAKQKLTILRNQALEKLNLSDHPIFIFRLHVGGKSQVKSLRKPLSEVFRNLNKLNAKT
ncbi:MAG: hypothetical protein ACI865_001722 [Flavobacteriaceae bacterium]|jgi:hypothetical protein